MAGSVDGKYPLLEKIYREKNIYILFFSCILPEIKIAQNLGQRWSKKYFKASPKMTDFRIFFLGQAQVGPGPVDQNFRFILRKYS